VAFEDNLIDILWLMIKAKGNNKYFDFFNGVRK
jgi:hypothetical protein